MSYQDSLELLILLSYTSSFKWPQKNTADFFLAMLDRKDIDRDRALIAYSTLIRHGGKPDPKIIGLFDRWYPNAIEFQASVITSYYKLFEIKKADSYWRMFRERLASRNSAAWMTAFLDSYRDLYILVEDGTKVRKERLPFVLRHTQANIKNMTEVMARKDPPPYWVEWSTSHRDFYIAAEKSVREQMAAKKEGGK